MRDDRQIHYSNTDYDITTLQYCDIIGQRNPKMIPYLIRTHSTILQYFTDSEETQQTDWQSPLRLLFLLICFMR